ncbi:MAG: efflux RND transporter periplasmic adaptor subunit, partial [Planctomycetota bacterium]
ILLLEAEEWIKASNELLKAADEEVAAEKARSDRSAKELQRVAELVAQQALSQSALDDARLDADTAVIELKKQVFTRAAVNIMTTVVAMGPRTINEYLDLKELQMRELTHQLAQARSRLARAEHDLALSDVTSPIDGIVLRRYEQGDAALPAGTQLLLVGNPEQLEVEVDVLTTDALKIAVGTPVVMEAPPGTVAARGKVRRIEPQAFTKLSSLGVEQQRVRTIVAIDEKNVELGVGYRLEARLLTGSRTDALKVARSSVLQAPDGSFYVLKVERGRIVETPVTIGLKSDLELEITSGLSQSDVIVAHGDTSLIEGMRVKALQ